ncbi:hypothetical protein CXB49_07590 [Chromobacterium sp. ATCC 53434]|uniref:hypothetical protein n=1 Tax=Chromobacterium sp. (strain ATCC 53434 / SC 14030) TaxID=2059672 RepID=UPI000C792EEE|nr:hypothetical protein [Chromobacterium sp. ATCC 53434]AUH50673.1 hypothetical protein CXB49_07590 [Chromobacterium sp. ATCC 53434]
MTAFSVTGFSQRKDTTGYGAVGENAVNSKAAAGLPELPEWRINADHLHEVLDELKALDLESCGLAAPIPDGLDYTIQLLAGNEGFGSLDLHGTFSIGDLMVKLQSLYERQREGFWAMQAELLPLVAAVVAVAVQQRSEAAELKARAQQENAASEVVGGAGQVLSAVGGETARGVAKDGAEQINQAISVHAAGHEVQGAQEDASGESAQKLANSMGQHLAKDARQETANRQESVSLMTGLLAVLAKDAQDWGQRKH